MKRPWYKSQVILQMKVASAAWHVFMGCWNSSVDPYTIYVTTRATDNNNWILLTPVASNYSYRARDVAVHHDRHIDD